LQTAQEGRPENFFAAVMRTRNKSGASTVISSNPLFARSFSDCAEICATARRATGLQTDDESSRMAGA